MNILALKQKNYFVPPLKEKGLLSGHFPEFDNLNISCLSCILWTRVTHRAWNWFISSRSITCRICRTQGCCEQFCFEMSRRTLFWGEYSVGVVTNNPPGVVTPKNPCGLSLINKKAHGRKCWLFLWISSLFPTRETVKILLWSSIGERVTSVYWFCAWEGYNKWYWKLKTHAMK